MQKNIIIGALTLSTILLAALNMHQHRLFRELAAEAKKTALREQVEPAIRTEQPQPPAAAEPPASVASKPVVTPAVTDDERATYERQIARLQTRLETATAAQEQKEDTTKSKPSRKAPMGHIADMLKDPGMKEVIRAQQKATMDLTYASLYNYLNLPEDRLAAFKELLLDRQMALMDVGLDMMDTSLSPEEKKAKAAAAEKVKEESTAKIHEFLGEENAEVFDQFEETQPERTQIHFFKQTLATTEPLTEEQEHDLITAMHEERKNFAISAKLEDPAKTDGAVFTEETVARHMQELAVLQERHAARAAEILTEKQLEQFRASQEQQRGMQEMGLKMAAQMFGTAPSEEKK